MAEKRINDLTIQHCEPTLDTIKVLTRSDLEHRHRTSGHWGIASEDVLAAMDLAWDEFRRSKSNGATK